MDDSSPRKRAASSKTRPVFVAGFCAEKDRKLILAAAVIASSMGFIDGTVVSIAMPAIRASLGASLDQATWINNAYMVPLAALLLTAGAFGDRFGLGRVFSLGIGFFVLASLVCALAPNPDILILARLAQGAGAALMIPGSLAMISRAYPREIRGRAIGLWAAASAVTTAGGPVVGGLILSLGGPEMWRGVFAINLPLGILAYLLTRRGVAQDTRTPGVPVDIPGAALAVLGLGLLSWALTHLEASNPREWTIITGVGGVALLALFIWQEDRSSHPVLPLRLFSSAVFSGANAATFLLYFGLSAILFFLPMLTIAGWGVSPFETIFAFAPVSIFVGLLSTRFGRWADKIGPGPVIATGTAIVAVGYALVALGTPAQSFWNATLPAMAVVGFGMAMVVAPLSAAVMGAVPDHNSGVASGVNNAVSRIAGLIAVAAMGSVATIVYVISGGPASYGETLADPVHIAAMGRAFAVIAWVASALAALACLLALTALRGKG